MSKITVKHSSKKIGKGQFILDTKLDSKLLLEACLTVEHIDKDLFGVSFSGYNYITNQESIFINAMTIDEINAKFRNYGVEIKGE